MSKTYKGLEIMQMISKGQIADRTRFNFENNNFDGVVEYYNGTLYWIIFDEKWNETGKKNLFEMFNIQSTMVADFELIEDEIDIDNIEELTQNCFDDWTEAKKINELVQAVNQLNKEIKELKSKEYCQVCGVELTEKNKYMKGMCYDCKYGEE